MCVHACAMLVDMLVYDLTFVYPPFAILLGNLRFLTEYTKCTQQCLEPLLLC